MYGQIAAIRLFHCRAEGLLCERVLVILSFTFVLSCVLVYSFSLV